MEVDLGAVRKNALAAQQCLHTDEPGIVAVVKADGYGLGAVAVSAALHEAGCTRFFVAYPDEAARLRQILPKAEIFVLHGAPPGYEADLAANRLIPVISTPLQREGWTRAAGGAPFALQLDTGMNRLGFSAAELAAHGPSPTPCLVMSHLAVPEEPAHPLNESQRDGFSAMLRFFPGLPASLSASSGIFLGAGYLFDWVRPGAALFGVNPQPGTPNPMSQVVRLQAKILQVRDVDSPMTVGYGATHRVARRGRIATISAGYADGVLRSLSNRGSAVVGGVRVPIVGRISMDLITLDVSDVPEGAAHEGGLADLIGPDLVVDEVARQADTIGYEILTSLGQRYARRYLPAA